jgi:hypothetical protein
VCSGWGGGLAACLSDAFLVDIANLLLRNVHEGGLSHGDSKLRWIDCYFGYVVEGNWLCRFCIKRAQVMEWKRRGLKLKQIPLGSGEQSMLWQIH